MKTIKKVFLLLLLLFFTFTLFAFGYYFAVTNKVSLIPEKLLLSEKTITLYDANGEVVHGATAALPKQTTSITHIPTHVKQAFIDVEDRRFYQHCGYDLKGIARASLHNIKARSFKEGASTISQQLIKNTHLTQEKTIKRKLKEWKLTRELEKTYSKQEILERYLNTIYFGHGCFGITAASEYYFGKSPAELSLSDAALLAGVVKAPNYYSPFKNAERCAQRKNVVLNAMLQNGSIRQAERLDAIHSPLPQAPQSKGNGGYAQFVFDELTALSEEYQFPIGGKIEIYTYLDKAAQKKAEEIVCSYKKSDVTALVLDGETHGFKACVSTVGSIQRLPGSLIKPLLVYAPAFEENLLSPATPILDAKINYDGYSPENYDGKYHGYVSARECIEKSLNIPAVKTLQALTVQKGAKYLEKLGLPPLKEDQSLALSLGGMKNGYPLRDVVAAYAAFQNGGVYEPCGFISSARINGVTVYKKPVEKRRAFSEETAYLTTDTLLGTAKRGTAKKLRSLPFEIAAKTGTVGTEKGNTDGYALSYTSRDCAAVWLGNADNSTVQCTGGGEPCNLLYEINRGLQALYENREETIPPFPRCNGVRRVALDKASYYDTHTLTLADDLAPEAERIYELFKINAIPLNKSFSFTNPTILPPTLSLTENGVKITFDERCPNYYEYKIDRYDYATHTTVYQGKKVATFTDGGLVAGKNYLYTVTPIYAGREGMPIALPVVTTKTGKTPSIAEKEILSKEWWEY